MSIDNAVSNVPNTGMAPDANVDAQRVTPPSIADQSQNLSSQDSRNAISQNGPTQNVAQPQAANAPKNAALNTPANPPVKSAPTPADIHQTLFRSVLETLGGGPTKTLVTDPNTGESSVRITHPTKKSLGASILAGAISGMMAGMAAPDKVDAYGHRDLSPSAQAGAQAGANMVQKRQTDAQQLEDSKLGRQYQTVKQNLDLHALSLSVNNLQGEAQHKLIDSAAPILEGMSLSKMPDGTDAIAGQHENEAALMKRIKESGGHITRDSALPDGVQDMIGPDGKPIPIDPRHPEYGNRQELTWTSFDNAAMVKITSAMRAEHPELTHTLDGQAAPVRALAQYFLNKGNTVAVSHSIDDVIKKQQEMSGDNKKIDSTWETIKKQHPSFGAYEAQMVGLAGLDPDQYVQGVMKINPQIGAALQQELGINYDKWAQKRETAKKKADVAEQLQLKKDEIAAANSPEAIQGAARKAAAEATARTTAETSDAAIAGKVKAAKALDQAKGAGEQVYATTPQGTYLMSKGDALDKNLPYSKVSVKQITEDRQLNNRLADVNQKIARYEQAFQAPLQSNGLLHQSDATLLSQVLGEDKFKAGAFGTELPVDWMNKLGNKSLKDNLSPAAVIRLVAYYNAREAMQGYSRVLSGSARGGEKAMQLNLDALPSPIDPDNYAKESIKQFRENVHIAGQGMPILPNVRTPEEIEADVKAGK